MIPGPNGLTIASEDLEALDEFERLLTTAADGSGNGPMAVFYLKYAKAEAVAEELDKILAGGVADPTVLPTRVRMPPLPPAAGPWPPVRSRLRPRPG